MITWLPFEPIELIAGVGAAAAIWTPSYLLYHLLIKKQENPKRKRGRKT